MKKILITGKGSFVGTSFEEYIKQYPDDYSVDTLDMLGEWRDADFSQYDVIFHVAGIAHSDGGKISEDKKKLYYAVNTDLAVEVATKAKADGVGQFIFMSSSIVYGQSYKIGKEKIVTADTPTAPENAYGDSKVKAEEGILPLESDSFKVVVLRPPVIYGRGCKGNYVTLTKIAKKLPIFPYVKNERSMLYIDNLTRFVELMIKNGESGIFYPQNKEYVNTSELVRMIGAAEGKRVRLIKGFGWAVRLLGIFVGFANKAFGNFTYDAEISEYKECYQVKSLEESVLEIHKK